MEVKPRSLPQSARFHAICTEAARSCPLFPYRRAFAVEAWKRHFIASWVHDARLEAYVNGRPDPFPVRPVPSRELDSAQMSELIEFASAWAAQHGIELSK